MVGDRKQEWIFEFIKGPDMVPVGEGHGLYSLRRKATVHAGEETLELGPEDILDFSGRTHLLVAASGVTRKLAWEAITGLVLEDNGVRPGAVTKPEVSLAGVPLPALATGKKTT